MPANYPSSRPLQAIDFTNQQKLDSRFQFSRSTSAEFVGADGLQQIAPAQAMRFAYDSAGQYLGGVVMEASSTNLLPWSNDITAPGWYYAPQNAPVSSGYIGIGGQPTAYRIGEGNLPGQWFIATSIAISGNVNYASSVFVKSDGVSRGYLQFYGVNASGILTGNSVAYFDLRRGEVYPENYGTNTLAASLEARKNGWFRVGAVGPFASESVLGILTLGFANDDGGAFYQGNGRGLLVDGFQVERNVSAPNAFVSSFIRTSGSAATRAIDRLDSSPNQFNDWYTQTSLTFYQDVILNNNDWIGDGKRAISSASNVNSTETAEIRIDSSANGATAYGRVVSGSTAYGTLLSLGSRVSNGLNSWENPASGTGTAKSVNAKMAFGFSPSGLYFAYNGTLGTFSSGIVPSNVSKMSILPFSHGRLILRKMAIFPLLPSGEAIQLTQP